MKRGLSVLIGLAVSTLPAVAFSAGFQLFNEGSARTTALGASMTARYDAVESAWFNPASVAMQDYKGMTGMAGMAVVMPSLKLNTATGPDPEMKNMAYSVPYAYWTMPYGDRLGFSMSVNVPYGLTTEWKADWIGKYYAAKTDLRCFFFTPAISYKLTDWLSLGVGAQIARADATLEKSVTPKVPGLTTKMEGDDTDFGYVLAATARPVKDWTVGLVYRSQVNFEIEGTAKYNLSIPGFYRSDMRLPLRLPSTLSFGVSTTAVPDWTLSADVLWTGWSSYESLTFYYDQAPGIGKPGVVSIPKEWNDCYSLRFGAEYRLNPEWVLRGSYVYDRTPIEDKYRDPTLPTNDSHLFGIGVGYTYKNWTIDGAYSYLYMEDAKTSPITPTLHGTYEATANIFNLSVSYKY
ncbi:MAG: outer membrane protein transport protein [Dissulfuribacterales bacterium]